MARRDQPGEPTLNGVSEHIASGLAIRHLSAAIEPKSTPVQADCPASCPAERRRPWCRRRRQWSLNASLRAALEPGPSGSAVERGHRRARPGGAHAAVLIAVAPRAGAIGGAVVTEAKRAGPPGLGGEGGPVGCSQFFRGQPSRRGRLHPQPHPMYPCRSYPCRYDQTPTETGGPCRYYYVARHTPLVGPCRTRCRTHQRSATQVSHRNPPRSS